MLDTASVVFQRSLWEKPNFYSDHVGFVYIFYRIFLFRFSVANQTKKELGDAP